MAATLGVAIESDVVLSFEINPGTLDSFLEARTEKGPLLKCFEGSVTLVSPGMPHELVGERLSLFILAICQELRIRFTPLASTTWKLPAGFGDTAYEADLAYYIQSHGRVQGQELYRPDLAVEIVVSNPASKPLRAGAFLKIPELWVLDHPRRRLTFHHLMIRGKDKGTYQPRTRSRAFPVLIASEIIERLDDPEPDAGAFHEGCRAWARQVLVPRTP